MCSLCVAGFDFVKYNNYCVKGQPTRLALMSVEIG